MTSNDNVSIGKYVGLFTLLQIFLMALFSVLYHSLDIDLGSSTNIAMLMAAAIVTSNQFVTKNKRAPRKTEKNKLVLGCILSSFSISALGALALILIFFGPQGFSEIKGILPQLSALTWLAIFAVVTFIHYLALNLSFGWYANRTASKIVSKA